MIFPNLPRELENKILEYNAEHREKFKNVMDELVMYIFINVLKKKVLWDILNILELEIQELLEELEEE